MIGNKVMINDINNMWDKEIYYQGWGLTDKESLKDYGVKDIPEFNDISYFENGDEATIITSDFIGDKYMLEIGLIDNTGKEYKCHSQTYSEEELITFCMIQ